MGFHQRALQDSQKLKQVTFCTLPVSSAQDIIGTEKYPDAGILFHYDENDYSQDYH